MAKGEHGRAGLRRRAVLLLRVSFWICLVGVLALAWLPAPPAELSTPWDKANHALAFYILAALAAAAYPGRRLIMLALGLTLVGVLIELVQATPWVRRDASALDVLADLVGIAACFGPVALARWRAG